MPDAKIDRRNFIQGATMAGAAAQIPAQKKMIGIQVGAISFLDEGVEQVLDIFQQRANVNTLFLGCSRMAGALRAGRCRASRCPITASRNTT
jgi:hypothetical protein